MDFSEALKLLKEGAVIRRDSWSGNKRIVLIPGSKNLTILPHIGIITKDERRVCILQQIAIYSPTIGYCLNKQCDNIRTSRGTKANSVFVLLEEDGIRFNKDKKLLYIDW